MTYDKTDIMQAGLGSIVAVLFFHLLRSGNPMNINPKTGLIIGLVWIYIVSIPFISKNSESKMHAIGNTVVAVVISSALALAFNTITTEQLFSFQFFSTTAWAGVMLALPTAHFFDKYNILNLYERWYHRRR